MRPPLSKTVYRGMSSGILLFVLFSGTHTDTYPVVKVQICTRALFTKNIQSFQMISSFFCRYTTNLLHTRFRSFSLHRFRFLWRSPTTFFFLLRVSTKIQIQKIIWYTHTTYCHDMSSDSRLCIFTLFSLLFPIFRRSTIISRPVFAMFKFSHIYKNHSHTVFSYSSIYVCSTI